MRIHCLVSGLAHRATGWLVSQHRPIPGRLPYSSLQESYQLSQDSPLVYSSASEFIWKTLSFTTILSIVGLFAHNMRAVRHVRQIGKLFQASTINEALIS